MKSTAHDQLFEIIFKGLVVRDDGIDLGAAAQARLLAVLTRAVREGRTVSTLKAVSDVVGFMNMQGIERAPKTVNKILCESGLAVREEGVSALDAQTRVASNFSQFENQAPARKAPRVAPFPRTQSGLRLSALMIRSRKY